MDRVTLDWQPAEFLLVVNRDAGAPLPEAPAPEAWAGPGSPSQVDLAPGMRLTLTGQAYWETCGDRGGMAIALPPARCGTQAGADAVRGALRALIEGRDPDPALRGRFLLLAWDTGARRIRAVTDGFRTYPLHYHASAERLVCATDLRMLLRCLLSPPPVEPVALYHYLNFAFVPSPFSPVRGVVKMPPDHRLEWPGPVLTPARPAPSYPEDLGGAEPERASALRERMIATVCDYLPGAETAWGTYLSGGTDSSSIAGILARFGGAGPFDTFSIGFREADFDERDYALLAARAFDLRNHTRDVDEPDAVAAIARLVAAFDEPFGNASAIGSLYCADLARSMGKRLLIAGDGGDEIFGGNERYAKDELFDRYQRAPAAVHALGRALALACAPLGSVHLANRLRRMEARGRMPNPDRFCADTDFASEAFGELLEPGFRQAVRRDASLELARAIHGEPAEAGRLNRMLYLDLRLTIADSDLVKVVRTARSAGIDVAFPYIDRELVEFTARLPEADKVRGLQKRRLFKQAMADVLPTAIQRKKKKGFGVPVRDWLRHRGAMRELVRDTVLSARALGRGYFQPRFVRRLLDEHERGAWDHGSDIFRLLMLELWHREHLDGRG